MIIMVTSLLPYFFLYYVCVWAYIYVCILLSGHLFSVFLVTIWFLTLNKHSNLPSLLINTKFPLTFSPASVSAVTGLLSLNVKLCRATHSYSTMTDACRIGLLFGGILQLWCYLQVIFLTEV